MTTRSAAALIVAMALAGCDAVPTPDQQQVAPPAGADLAAGLALAAWSQILDESTAWTSDDLPPISWYAGDCLTVGGVNPLGAGCLLGVTYTPGGLSDGAAIYLVRRGPFGDNPRPSETQFAHEVLHWTLYLKYGDPDSEHTRPAWGKIGDVNQALADHHL